MLDTGSALLVLLRATYKQLFRIARIQLSSIESVKSVIPSLNTCSPDQFRDGTILKKFKIK